METDKQKQIKMFKSFAKTLHDKSVLFYRMSFRLKPKKTTGAYVKSFLASKGVPLSRISLPDTRILQYVSIEEMRDIIFYDSTDEIVYEADIQDCDDFSDIFQSHMKENYKLNIVGEARNIELLDIETGGHLNWHRANIFIADENNVMKLWFLEPQTDKVVEVEDYNKLIKLTGWLNRLNIFDF